MPQTKQEKRKAALNRLIRFAKQQNPQSEAEHKKQAERLDHIRYLQSIENRQ